MAMAAPTLAWGEVHLFELPNGRSLYGREFELLPAGTMFAAGVILHGIIGLTARVNEKKEARVVNDGKLLIYAIRDTDRSELLIYRDDITEAFRRRQLQDAQG